MRTEGHGLEIEVAKDWHCRIWRTPEDPDIPGRRFANLHLANFDLPADDGNFGGTALQRMQPGDVFVALVEYEPEAAHKGWFAFEGLPSELSWDQLSDAYLRESRPGQVGLQLFCTVGNRPFCLYVVAMKPPRATSLKELNDALATVRAGAVEWAS